MKPRINYCVIMGGGIWKRFWPMRQIIISEAIDLDILGTGRTLDSAKHYESLHTKLHQ